LKDIAAASKDLAARAKDGALHPQEYSGGTFAISNMGMFDVTSFVAIIQPPQTAVLAVGTVVKRPVVKDDQVAIAQTMTATLSADHRIVDGAEGARFLNEVKRRLENPLGMLV
ncbi:MAG: 2-oxo acid dehydrogenase subunit E2, partial [SAR202 cluster bacterium]|nr:2-oxo acid dehydrogenase subunit E2 [SAR202 cluster bacterium]